MKKWFALALAALLLVPALACAASLTVQDFGSFASGLVSLESEKELDYSLEWKYTGTDEEIWTAVDEYAKLLDEKADYKLFLEGYFKPNSSRKVYWFSYTGSEKLSGFGVSNDKQEWDLNSCVGYISVYDGGGNKEVKVWLSKDMDVADHGERASVAVSGKSSVKTSSSSSTSSSSTTKKNSGSSSSSSSSSSTSRTRCTSCGGDGRKESSCTSCGGDGKKNCISCNGRGKYDCGGCYNGDVRCGACGGTGKGSGNRSCSSCGGDGEKRCSSCSGTGERRCTGCGGTGDKRCTSCGGDGRKESSCTSCGGDGWR